MSFRANTYKHEYEDVTEKITLFVAWSITYKHISQSREVILAYLVNLSVGTEIDKSPMV